MFRLLGLGFEFRAEGRSPKPQTLHPKLSMLQGGTFNLGLVTLGQKETRRDFRGSWGLYGLLGAFVTLGLTLGVRV